VKSPAPSVIDTGPASHGWERGYRALAPNPIGTACVLRTMHLFVNPHERRLRLPWRLLLHAAAVAAFGVGAAFPLAEGLTSLHRRGMFLPGVAKQPYDLAINMLVGPLLAAGVVLATVLCTRRLDKRATREIGLGFGWRWLGNWAFGLVLGGALQACIFLVEATLGWTRVAW